VASVWRRQTFSAAVDSCTPEMSLSILYEQIPELMQQLNGALPTSGGVSIMDSAYEFSRMLHGSNSTGDAFYRAFVPELGSTLYPRQIELVKRCLRSERSEFDRVGATIFPGLVKVSRGPPLPDGQYGDNVQVSLPCTSRVDVDLLGIWPDCRKKGSSNLRMCNGGQADATDASEWL
jgi:hypothetical protein